MCAENFERNSLILSDNIENSQAPFEESQFERPTALEEFFPETALHCKFASMENVNHFNVSIKMANVEIRR
ncbi:Uncharacterized protein APZ42_003428 [Daphnia magna]|uniref:Uncharacterized protein n=1 Tax=Daphnia magna TaxID=35525 RepID=A0A164HJK2_9CRUS|nr:Uncharacterized protein APZ42_003428 [Daphnia magna]